MKLIKNCNRPPKNTSLWPKSEIGEVIFVPYGPEGAGFYLVIENK